jgi:hypothetical protein
MEKKSELYKNALKNWALCGVREPHGLIAGSLWFWLCCLPVVTFGPAQMSLVYYMGRRRDGIKISWKEAFRFGLKRNAFLMGLSDFLAVILAAGSFFAVIETSLPAPLRYVYAFVLTLDLLYLLSGTYRYPALAKDPWTKPGLLMLRGFLMAVGNLGYSLLFFCAQLLFFTACLGTGAGLLILYPAGQALLAHCAYAEMAKPYKTR